MPELPEVETTARGVAPHVLGQTIADVSIRDGRLRWPVPAQLPQVLRGLCVHDVRRRGKYILFDCGRGHLLVHLGMSGSLRVTTGEVPLRRHDHIAIRFSNAIELRFHDPRRFGAMLWTEASPAEHKLLVGLGPEPLESDFDASYLYQRSRHRRSPVKAFIMDSKVVVGVGNIYANEALFIAGIHPTRAAGRISLPRYQHLVEAIKSVLASAIEQGGTTLRDFVNGDGQPGYFSQQLWVYGRGSKPCGRCGGALREIRLAQRTTVYCLKCQR